jgi:serine/threonine protein kinase
MLQQYCKITHLDIKPENLIYSQNSNLRIIDFGSSRYLEYKNPKQLIHITKPLGTKNYAAPEILKGYYNCTSDVYSIGRLLHYFKYSNMNLGHDGNNLLHDMLTTDPTIRPTLSEVLDSPWFTS